MHSNADILTRSIRGFLVKLSPNPKSTATSNLAAQPIVTHYPFGLEPPKHSSWNSTTTGLQKYRCRQWNGGKLKTKSREVYTEVEEGGGNRSRDHRIQPHQSPTATPDNGFNLVQSDTDGLSKAADSQRSTPGKRGPNAGNGVCDCEHRLEIPTTKRWPRVSGDVNTPECMQDA
ncbi:hypothetical protein Aperf_G00000072005 [Anoplocephala perfoliata]